MSESNNGESSGDSRQTHHETHGAGNSNVAQHLSATEMPVGESRESIPNLHAHARACAHTRVRAEKTHDTHQTHQQGHGPIRTLKRGDRIAVHGVLEIVDMDGRHVQVRLHPSPPSMFPVKAQLNTSTS